jgi:hypothetical protein
VVLMVPLIGSGRPCTSGSTGGRAAAEEEGSPVLRSGGSGAQERVWMGRGVSANDGDVVCVQDQGWGVVVRAADGEAERAADRSSPVLRETTLRCKKMELGGSMSYRVSRWCSKSIGLGVRRWCGELPTVVRGDNGGPVSNGDRIRGKMEGRGGCKCQDVL